MLEGTVRYVSKRIRGEAKGREWRTREKGNVEIEEGRKEQEERNKRYVLTIVQNDPFAVLMSAG